MFTGIVKNEGPLTLWKGSLFPLVCFGACSSILFAVNENLKEQFLRLHNRERNTITETAIAGGFAGLANSVISSPMEHIRIRMQTQKSTAKIYEGSVDCAKKILK